MAINGHGGPAGLDGHQGGGVLIKGKRQGINEEE
jgi:hypothetical protein